MSGTRRSNGRVGPDSASGRRRNHAIWLGLLVTSFGGVSYFEVFARYPSLRDFPWLNQPLVLVGLGISFLGLLRAVRASEDYGGRVVGPIGFGVSLALATAFHWYVFEHSFDLPAPTRVVLPGDTAPDFALRAHDGESVRLSDYRGRKVVLAFYRGHW